MVSVGSVEVGVKLALDDLARQEAALRQRLGNIQGANVKVGFDGSAVQQGLQGLQGQSKSLIDGLVQGVGLGVANAALGALQGALGAIGGLAQSTLAVGSAAQEAEISFQTFLGSVEAGNAAIADLRQFAATTPFEFPEVRAAGQQLLAFGITAEELIPTLTRIGDIAAGSGVPFNELTAIYGKARTQGRLFQEDINQLAGRGINITGELAKNLGVAESEIRSLTEAGRINFADIEKAFITMSEEGSKFGWLMERLSQSIPGQLSNLADSFTEVQRSAFEAVAPGVAAGIQVISGSIQEAGQQVEGIDRLRESTEGFAKVIEDANIDELLGDALARIANEIIDGAIAAFNGLSTAIRENPKLIESATKLFGDFGVVLVQQVRFIVEFVAAIASIQNAAERFTTVFEILGNLLKIIGGTLELVGQGFSNLAQLFAQLGGSDLPDTFVSLGDSINSILETIINAIDKVKELNGLLNPETANTGVNDIARAFNPNRNTERLGPEPQAPEDPAAAQRQFKEELAQVDTETAQATARIRQQQADGALTERQAVEEIARVQQEAIQRQIALTEERLTKVKEGSEEEKELVRSLANLQTEAAEAQIAAQERVRAARLREIEDQNRLAQGRSRIGSNEDVRAIREQQLQRVITAKEAEEQIAQVRRRSLDIELADKQRQIAQIAQLRAEGVLTEEEAIKRRSDLEVESSNIRVQQVEAAIAAQQQLQEAELKRIEETAAAERSAVEFKAGLLQIELDSIGQRSQLLQAETAVNQALTEQVQQRLAFRLQEAQAEGNTAQVAALQRQILFEQSAALLAQQEVERESLALQQEQIELQLQQQEIQGQIALTEAEIAIQQAEARDASAQEIANLERIAQLRERQLEAIAGQAESQERINQLAEQELGIRQQTQREAQVQAERELQREQAQSREGDRSSGDTAGGRGQDITAFGSTNVSQLNEARSIIDASRDSISETSELLSRVLSGTNPFIEQLLALQGRSDILDLAAISRSGSTQDALRAQDFARALDTGTGAQISALTQEIRRLANSPRVLSVSAPDPIGSVGSLLNQISANSTASIGL